MSPHSPAIRRASNPRENWTSIESSAFFIREQKTGREIIIFGDVEPDSISLDPRNKRVWEAAAPRIASGLLRAIFIECSYTDDVDDQALYGHLCPRHLIAELTVLAREVVKVKQAPTWTHPIGKRKRSAGEALAESQPTSPKTRRLEDVLPEASITTSSGMPEPVYGGSPDTEGREWPLTEPPLEKLTIYLIHIKEDMEGGPDPSVTIVKQLKEQAQAANLGCSFYAPRRGESIRIGQEDRVQM
jgi:cAMP phosphodiesterase